MKTNQILIIIGVIAIVLIIMNWQKIFAKKYANGGVIVEDVNSPLYPYTLNYYNNLNYLRMFPTYNQLTLERLAMGINTMSGPGTWWKTR